MNNGSGAIAVLGTGLAGSLVALELAERGYHVDLYDKENEPISGASSHNEGKVHLGFVYAKDNPHKTARTMIDGALRFVPLLSRWVQRKVIEEALSSPFIYGLHRDSMVDEDTLTTHFKAVDEMIRERPRSSSTDYIGPISACSWHPMEQSQHEAIFDPEWITRSFQTDERAVDVQVIAGALRDCLRQAPRLDLRLGLEVFSVKRAKGALEVRWRDPAGAERQDRYAQVVNALWHNRAAIDAGMDLVPNRPLLHRYKVGFSGKSATTLPDLESVTFVLGSFGDTVRFRDGFYLSWYPSGLLHQETALKPDFQPPAPGSDHLKGILESGIKALIRLMPGSQPCLQEPSLDWRALGGFISAWGESGIEDPSSELHQRYRVGVMTRENYHSVDTGKYTLAPMFARQACQRIVE